MSVAEPSKINVHGPLLDLCARLGLDHKCVASLLITPRHVEATVYVLSATGHKYLAPNGEPAATTVVIPVVT